MRSIVFKAALLLLCFPLARFCHHQTAGFRLTKIAENFFPLGKYEATLEEEERAKTILQQKFTYLGRGLQSFAFLSEDGSTVLKIFNNRHNRKLFWFNLLKQTAKSEQVEKKRKNAFQSYIIASNELKEESGLLYLHLQQTNHLQQTTRIIDKLNIEHPIDLDKTGFLLQKRAVPIYEQLAAWRRENDIVAAKKGLVSLLQLILLRYQKGIGDNDPLLRTNFGFLEGKAMQIDVGPFFAAAEMRDPETYLPQIVRTTTSLKVWLTNHFPELLPDLENLLTILHEKKSL